MKTWLKTITEYVIVHEETGEVLPKVKKILFDKTKYRESKRETKFEIKNYQNYEYRIKTITVCVREHEQLTIF